MMLLGDFLRAQAGSTRPWNCSTLPGDWCVALGHPDFVKPWRHIVDFVECEEVADEAGGLSVLWEKGIGGALPEVLGPLLAGDIAVVRILSFEAGAIWTGERWALKVRRGLHFAASYQVERLRAWRP